jgi:hypothetical protein
LQEICDPGQNLDGGYELAAVGIDGIGKDITERQYALAGDVREHIDSKLWLGAKEILSSNQKRISEVLKRGAQWNGIPTKMRLGPEGTS